MASLRQVQWYRLTPLLLFHAACLLVLYVGWSRIAVVVAIAVYFARVFGLTAFYHRYFSHRAFKTSRTLQFLGALLGSSAGQGGPIWWAAHHRHHHRASDGPDDLHSPQRQGFLWSHLLWFMTREAYGTNYRVVKDWVKFPELRFLERHDSLAPAIGAILMYALGEWIGRTWPSAGTSGLQMVVWGGAISSVALYHATFAVNSFAHTYGSRRFATNDDSRNNLWLALLTFGEGWHNNHHYFPSSARQGFRWWEIDISYYLLVIMSWLGLVWDLKPVPARILESPQAVSVRRPA